MSTGVDTRPVGSDDIPDLATLFATERTTRHCWCMAFCITRSQFAVGWLTGGNRRTFEALASDGETPMGILASDAGEPVGWCACGPRSRYSVATGPRSLLRNRIRAEDESAWLLPCLFIRAEHRRRGVTHALVGAAVDLARRQGAVAIEGWPLSESVGRSPDAFVGREQVFADVGFQRVDQPTAQRVVMRKELTGTGGR